MELGAHCKNHNNKAIGICFVGNFDEASVPDQQWKKGVKLVKWLCSRFGIPVSRIYGHRDFANKTCPGTMFDIEKFKADVEAYHL
jgi:N-acetyl-anhydromuramyl-L-alanine amidase AmpD